jgi:GNAT superfamily N-acetyltransferase
VQSIDDGKASVDASTTLTFQPLTARRWSDLEQLFGPRGAVGGCWCMWWRRTRSEFEACKGEANRSAFQAIVAAGDEPGILAYVDSEPIGWCAVAPREEYAGLQRSRTLKPVDDAAVWSITCFFIARRDRRAGVSAALLDAAVDFAQSRGARIVEGYPVEPRSPNAPDIYVWTGFRSTFQQAGFVEVARRSETRPIMRLRLDES